MPEDKYTLDEAQRILALRKCAWGHTDLHEIHSGEETVAITLYCSDCGTSYVKKEKSENA